MKNRIIETFKLSTLNNSQNNYNNVHTGGAESARAGAYSLEWSHENHGV